MGYHRIALEKRLSVLPGSALGTARKDAVPQSHVPSHLLERKGSSGTLQRTSRRIPIPTTLGPILTFLHCNRGVLCHAGEVGGKTTKARRKTKRAQENGGSVDTPVPVSPDAKACPSTTLRANVMREELSLGSLTRSSSSVSPVRSSGSRGSVEIKSNEVTALLKA